MGEILKYIKVLKTADIIASTAAIGSAEIASSAIVATHIGAGEIGSTALATGAVVAAKLGAGAVGSAALGAGAVVAAKIGAGAVGSAALGDDAVTGAKIANDGVIASTKIDFLSGTSAIGTVETDIAHGLAQTPSFVLIYPQSNTVIWESTAADGTNIKLTGSAAGTTKWFAFK